MTWTAPFKEFIPLVAIIDGAMVTIKSFDATEICFESPPVTTTGEVAGMVIGECRKEYLYPEFTVTVAAPAVITSIDPESGSVCGGYTATISGSDFYSGTTVLVSGVLGGETVSVPFFDGTPALSETQITGVVADHSAYGAGSATITVLSGPEPECESGATTGFLYVQDECIEVEPYLELATGVDAPAIVAVGDMNNDGNNDVVAGFNGDNHLVVFYGDGAGNFPSQTSVILESSDSPNALCTGDLNGDGRDDIAVACNSKRMVRMLQDSGGFLAVQSDALVLPGTPSSILAADMSDDAVDDVVIQLSDYPHLVFTTDGLSSIEIPTGDLPFPAVATINGTMPGTTRSGVFVAGRNTDGSDGYLNFIENNSGGDGLTWTPNPISLPKSSGGTLFIPSLLALANWAGDSHEELILASSESPNVQLMSYTHGGTLMPYFELYTGVYPQIVMRGSFFAAYYPTQLAVTMDSEASSVALIMEAGGTIHASSKLSIRAGSMAIGKLNADDSDDVVLGLENGHVALLLSPTF